MDNLIKILVVEDEMLIRAKISMQVTNLGYEITGILPRGYFGAAARLAALLLRFVIQFDAE